MHIADYEYKTFIDHCAQTAMVEVEIKYQWDAQALHHNMSSAVLGLNPSTNNLQSYEYLLSQSYVLSAEIYEEGVMTHSFPVTAATNAAVALEESSMTATGDGGVIVNNRNSKCTNNSSNNTDNASSNSSSVTAAVLSPPPPHTFVFDNSSVKPVSCVSVNVPSPSLSNTDDFDSSNGYGSNDSNGKTMLESSAKVHLTVPYLVLWQVGMNCYSLSTFGSFLKNLMLVYYYCYCCLRFFRIGGVALCVHNGFESTICC